MSGAEAVVVVGLIGRLISIIDEAKEVCDATGDAKGQPEEFRQVAAQLPPVIEILRNTEARSSILDETNLEAIEQTLTRGFYKSTATLHTACEIKALRRTLRWVTAYKI